MTERESEGQQQEGSEPQQDHQQEQPYQIPDWGDFDKLEKRDGDT